VAKSLAVPPDDNFRQRAVTNLLIVGALCVFICSGINLILLMSHSGPFNWLLDEAAALVATFLIAAPPIVLELRRRHTRALEQSKAVDWPFQPVRLRLVRAGITIWDATTDELIDPKVLAAHENDEVEVSFRPTGVQVDRPLMNCVPVVHLYTSSATDSNALYWPRITIGADNHVASYGNTAVFSGIAFAQLPVRPEDDIRSMSWQLPSGQS